MIFAFSHPFNNILIKEFAINVGKQYGNMAIYKNQVMSLAVVK